jgi:hypothetical protein
MDQVTAFELGFARGYETPCASLSSTYLDTGTKIPAVTQPAMPDEFYDTIPLKYLTLVEVLAAVP